MSVINWTSLKYSMARLPKKYPRTRLQFPKKLPRKLRNPPQTPKRGRRRKTHRSPKKRMTRRKTATTTAMTAKNGRTGNLQAGGEAAARAVTN
nr:hypothetical protein Iba_chr15dCG2730 [Ipomoea batatas]